MIIFIILPMILKFIMYPIVETIYKSHDSCDHKWIPQKEIGTEGTYGEVWSVCCNNDCNHALKYMPYNDGIRMNSTQDIINEIKMQNACADVGLCPYIQDAWLTDKGGVVVMDLYKITAKQMLLMHDSIVEKQKILAYIVTLVDKLHRYGIYHGDLHLDNIMVSTDNKYYFIDFGKGGRFTNMNDPHIKEDYIDISAHIQDLIDEYPDNNFTELYDTMKIYMGKFD